MTFNFLANKIILSKLIIQYNINTIKTDVLQRPKLTVKRKRKKSVKYYIKVWRFLYYAIFSNSHYDSASRELENNGDDEDAASDAGCKLTRRCFLRNSRKHKRSVLHDCATPRTHRPCVTKGSHSFTCQSVTHTHTHTHIYTILAFTPELQGVTAIWLVLTVLTHKGMARLS